MELTTTIPSFQTRRPPAHLFVGATALLVSHILLFARVEPVYTYFFSFAWWPCILLLDGLVYWRTGDSLLVNRPGEFVLVAFVSIPAWCLYEVFNFRLQNWYYVMLPQAPWGYRLNYAVGFSMAFPAIFETMAFLQSFPFLHRVRTPPFPVTRRVLSVVFCVGVAATILPLSWPALFFPLVWVTTTLLLEPILYLRGGRSLLADLERGNPQRLLTLLAAGVVCGGLWEFWNFLTRAKWIYTVPFFEDLKLFEMPLLGYLGFPAFAIECYVMYAFVGLFRANRGWESEPGVMKMGKKRRNVPG